MLPKQRLTTQQLTLLGIILGLRIVLSYIPSINMGPYVQMGLGFIGAALSGILFGPFYAMLIGVLADIITALLQGMPFFFGYTLSAGLAGLIYGWGFWRRPITLGRIFITVLIITLVVNLGLGSLWVRMMTGKAWSVFMGMRLIKNVISLFLNTGLLYILFNQPTIRRYLQRRQF